MQRTKVYPAVTNILSMLDVRYILVNDRQLEQVINFGQPNALSYAERASRVGVHPKAYGP